MFLMYSSCFLINFFLSSRGDLVLKLNKTSKKKSIKQKQKLTTIKINLSIIIFSKSAQKKKHFDSINLST